MIALQVADTKFLTSNSSETPSNESNIDSDMIKRCLIFLPCVTFGLAADIQIIVSTRKYKPIAFAHMPYSHTRCFMLFLAFLSLLQTLCTYGFCFLVFGGISNDPRYRHWVFACFIVKALTWSPYLGFELYDTLFEQIYYDVNFQINFIKPAGSRSPSPRVQSSKNSSSAVAKNKEILSFVQEQNDCSATGGNVSTTNDDLSNSFL